MYSRMAALPSGRRTVSRTACKKRPVSIFSCTTVVSSKHAGVGGKLRGRAVKGCGMVGRVSGVGGGEYGGRDAEGAEAAQSTQKNTKISLKRL